MAVMAGQASAEFWPRSLGVIHLSAVLGELLDPPRKILLMLTQKLFILISPPLRGARWGAKSTQERLLGPATHTQADYRDIHSFIHNSWLGQRLEYLHTCYSTLMLYSAPWLPYHPWLLVDGPQVDYSMVCLCQSLHWR